MAAGRILIVEDDPSARECYGKLLRRHGYEPRLAASPGWVEGTPEALVDVPLILLDYRLPGMTGLELLRRLRRRGFAGAAVLISAQVSPEMLQEAKRLGIYRIFHKPVDGAALLETVAEAITHIQEKGQTRSSGANALI
jgi:DNA-binding NtrC family response regulator